MGADKCSEEKEDGGPHLQILKENLMQSHVSGMPMSSVYRSQHTTSFPVERCAGKAGTQNSCHQLMPTFSESSLLFVPAM